MEQQIDDFARCACLAREAGYDGVEIMGSEGYLINQFMSGGNQSPGRPLGRAAMKIGSAFPWKSCVEACPEHRGKRIYRDFPSLHARSGRGGSGWDEISDLAKAVEAAGATIINTGIGWHEARIPTIAAMVPRAAFTWVTSRLKGEVEIPLSQAIGSTPRRSPRRCWPGARPTWCPWPARCWPTRSLS